jgi:hypothetical protein
VIEIIPPTDNTIDALAAETLLGSLLTTGSLFALEIAGDARGVRFLARAPRETLDHICRQIHAVYGQVAFREIARADDVAARALDLPTPAPPGSAAPAPHAASVILSAEMSLRRPAYLPLRTYRDGDFREADPMHGLLGAFTGAFDAREFVMAQIVLTPAPHDWADRYQASARRLGQTMGGEQIGAASSGDALGQFVAMGVVLFALVPCIGIAIGYATQNWVLFALALTVTLLAGAGAVAAFMFLRPQTVDPAMVQRKIATPAFDATVRLIAVGKSAERAQARLRQLAGAYQMFNIASGNSLIARRAVCGDPSRLSAPAAQWTWMQNFSGRVMRLNISELASLWHLPVGQGAPMVDRTLSKRLPPARPDLVAHGIPIGISEYQGQQIQVRLPSEILQRHSFLVAKTQKGKSTLMGHLAAAVMEQDAALVVIDPHGDLARALIGVVPRARVGDVMLVDFSDKQQVVGLNLLDMAQERDADVIVSNIVHVGELIWADYWGPRMEDALRMALRTLLAANEKLAHSRQKQFTLIDIPSLFELPSFRKGLVRSFVKDNEVLRWWDGYFDRLNDNLRMEVINPVLTKIHRFSTHSVVRNIIGQSESTVNFRDLLEQRRILLVNTATGVIGPDAGGLLGAVVVDYINFAVREQMAIADASARARVVIVIDEFQSIPGVDYPGLLAELQKMGASFILATQALGQLDALDKKLRPSILSNTGTLFVFQTSAEDADYLSAELDEAVTVTDIINLPAYACYVKTQLGRERLPVMRVETYAPAQENRAIAERIGGQMRRYTRPAAVVESERLTFQQQWYGREMSMLRTVALTQEQARGTPKPKGGYDDTQDRQPNDISPAGQDFLADHAVNKITGAPITTADPPTVREEKERQPLAAAQARTDPRAGAGRAATELFAPPAPSAPGRAANQDAKPITRSAPPSRSPASSSAARVADSTKPAKESAKEKDDWKDG